MSHGVKSSNRKQINVFRLTTPIHNFTQWLKITWICEIWVVASVSQIWDFKQDTRSFYKIVC